MPIHDSAYVHPRAVVCGDVTLGAQASVWPTAVVRADTASIVIGERSNIQDGAVVHVDHGCHTRIGARVAVGHRAVIHGATVEDDCLIAMGAILLNSVRVGAGSIVSAGALCPDGMEIPRNSLLLGVPGRVVRETTAAERQRIARTVASYLELQDRHRRGDYPLVGAGSGE